jgi:hypothetical protein
MFGVVVCFEGRLFAPQLVGVTAVLLLVLCLCSQLNMGEGKTRVILPMLALECANGQQLVRLNFLPTLLDEANGHLHRYLTASVLERKLFLMPFNRDVKLDVIQARTMKACLMYCQQVSAKFLAGAACWPRELLPHACHSVVAVVASYSYQNCSSRRQLD